MDLNLGWIRYKKSIAKSMVFPSVISLFAEQKRGDDDHYDDNTHDQDAVRRTDLGLILCNRSWGDLLKWGGHIRVLREGNRLVEICNCPGKNKQDE